MLSAMTGNTSLGLTFLPNLGNTRSATVLVPLALQAQALRIPQAQALQVPQVPLALQALDLLAPAPPAPPAPRALPTSALQSKMMISRWKLEDMGR